MQVTTISLDLAKSVFQVQPSMSRQGGHQGEAGPGRGAEVLRVSAALPARHGSLRHRPPLGSRALCARPMRCG